MPFNIALFDLCRKKKLNEKKEVAIMVELFEQILFGYKQKVPIYSYLLISLAASSFKRSSSLHSPRVIVASLTKALFAGILLLLLLGHRIISSTSKGTGSPILLIVSLLEVVELQN
jgi:hypothetical protein